MLTEKSRDALYAAFTAYLKEEPDGDAMTFLDYACDEMNHMHLVDGRPVPNDRGVDMPLSR